MTELDEGTEAIIEKIIRRIIPCETGKLCKEVHGLRKLFIAVLFGFGMFVAGLVLNYVEAKNLNYMLEKRLDRIDDVMGIIKK